MGILQFASEDTKRIDLGEGDYVEVKSDVSKRLMNELVGAMPNRELSEESGLTLTEGLSFQQVLFTTLVTGWSLPEAPTLEAYLNLTRAAGDAIDAALAEHFNSLAPSKEEASKVSTSRGSRTRGSGRTR